MVSASVRKRHGPGDSMRLRCVYIAFICVIAAASSICAQQSAAKPSGGSTTAGLRFERDPATFPGGRLYSILPSEADPSIKRFDKTNLVLVKDGLPESANLLVFFPGTGGEPNGSWPFLEAGANAGYRVIGLMY